MLKSNKYKLDFLKLRRIVIILVLISGLFGLFLYFLMFQPEEKKIAFLNAKIVAGLSQTARTAFQNCIIELDNNSTVLASCDVNNRKGDLVRVMKITSSNGKSSYQVCNKNLPICLSRENQKEN